ncbi:MAG: hypothetical protein AAFX01_10890 [Cyanobacteria bacterium J06638_28]
MSKQSSTAASTVFSTNTLILLGLGWAFISLLVFLFGSSAQSPEGYRYPLYLNSITILETGAFVLASIACLRNWKSKQILSGRNVWLWIGVGLLFYAAGNVFFYLWNNQFGLDPSASLGDFFYFFSYIFLAGGMLQSVLNRQLHLEFRQWLIIGVVGVLGVAIALFPLMQSEDESALLPESFHASLASVALGAPAIAQDTPPVEAPPPEGTPAPEVTPAPASEPVPEGTPAPEVTPAPEGAPTETPVEEPVAEEVAAPGWAVSIDNALEPFEGIVGFMYVIGDCLLIVVATTLLVAFWDGRSSQSWKMIAIAAFCLYIADMLFAYQDYYQEGSLWEVFWTFSAVFFGLGAVVEYAISSRSRSRSRRRRA